MARRVVTALALVILLLSLGCGVKAPPLPSTEVAPRRVGDLTARPLADGIEVGLSIPGASKPRQQIDEIRIYYGYLPLTGDPDCPPCPPKLRRYHTFNLDNKDDRLMKGGRFTWVDHQAPMGKEAVYQVVLVDQAGRPSEISGLARAPRVIPPKAPVGLKALQREGEVLLVWEGQPIPDGEAPGPAGWRVYRRGPQGEKLLNLQPLLAPELSDQTVIEGSTYAYKVAAVERVGGTLVEGPAGEWVEARARDLVAPAPPSDLLAASTAEGIFLRFTPSPDQDTAGYHILRADGPGGEWRQIDEALVQENTFVDRGVKVGQTYRYAAVAVDEAGNLSEKSAVLEVVHEP